MKSARHRWFDRFLFVFYICDDDDDDDNNNNNNKQAAEMKNR